MTIAPGEPACSQGGLEHSQLTGYRHVVPAGLDLEACLKPLYWRNVVQRLGGARFTTIELLADDNAWEALVRVTSVEAHQAHVRVLFKWEQKGKAPPMPKGYAAEFIAGQGFRVRDPHNGIVAEKLPDIIVATKAAIKHAS